MIQLSDRTKTFTDSIIRRMTRICLKYDAVNLSQGMPDFDPPKALTEALAKAAINGPHQYALTMGAKNLRDVLAAKIERFSGTPCDPEKELCVVCGSTEAMMASVMATLNPGDKVAIFSPFYENYGADAILGGVEPIYVPLVPPVFNFDEKILDKAFSDGARALILCNPSNPSGKVFTKEELEAIARVVIRHDAFVITDEVYEHILYKPHVHTYMHTLPGMKERTIVCNSFSKTYSITGWRIGYVYSCEPVIDRVKKVHDFLTIGAAAPIQEALVTALNFDDGYYQELQEIYTKKRRMFLDGLDSAGLKYFEPQGAYFVMVDISEFGYESDYEFSVDLIKKVGVGGVCGSSFFKENVNRYIRFHFAKKEDSLKAGLERLQKIKSAF